MMQVLLTRTISGAVFVATIVLPLLFLPQLYSYVIALYGLLTLYEFVAIIKKLMKNTVMPKINKSVVSVSIALVWIVLPFTILIFMPLFAEILLPEVDSSLMTILVFLFIWTHDSFAYLIGVIFGKTPLMPQISPLKTVEGSAGGLIFAALLSTILAVFLIPELHHFFWIGAVLVTSVFGTLGDLAESKIKRLAGVKDSGNLMPGHGGFFDRFDAVLFIAPVWLILMSAASLFL